MGRSCSLRAKPELHPKKQMRRDGIEGGIIGRENKPILQTKIFFSVGNNQNSLKARKRQIYWNAIKKRVIESDDKRCCINPFQKYCTVNTCPQLHIA